MLRFLLFHRNSVTKCELNSILNEQQYERNGPSLFCLQILGLLSYVTIPTSVQIFTIILALITGTKGEGWQ
jgi:hypothetical protein